MTRANRSAFSVRLQRRSRACASRSVNDSTSSTKGLKRRPRPWMLELRAPPMLRRSAPVCFCRKVSRWVSSACSLCRAASRPGHCIPACTVISRWPGRKSTTRSNEVRSSCSPPSTNCCPPMACRPPQMEIGRSALAARWTTATICSTERGDTSSRTRIGLSRECTSFSTIGAVMTRPRTHRCPPPLRACPRSRQA